MLVCIATRGGFPFNIRGNREETMSRVVAPSHIVADAMCMIWLMPAPCLYAQSSSATAKVTRSHRLHPWHPVTSSRYSSLFSSSSSVTTYALSFPHRQPRYHMPCASSYRRSSRSTASKPGWDAWDESLVEGDCKARRRSYSERAVGSMRVL